MSNPIANFNGLSSGVQWNDVIDRIMQVEEARLVTPIVQQLDQRAAQRAAWTRFQPLVNSLNDAARALRRPAFGGFAATVPPSPLTSRTLFSASASSTAQPGRYRVEVVQLAETAKLGGSSVADRTAALGLSGDFSINGTTITVQADDSLEAIRTRINEANTGETPTGVIATVVREGATGGRLVLTRSTAGSAGITIADGTGGIARELGLLDTRSRPISSTALAIASALGLQLTPPPATIRVNGQVITVDLSVDSIATIVAKVNAAGGSASAQAEPFGDEVRHRLVIDGNVTADDADGEAIISALGLAAGQPAAIRQTVATGVLSAAGGAIATAATALAGLELDGAPAGLAVGDAINIRGTRGDGTTVTIGIAIDPGETVQDLLDKINDATAGFGAGGRPATATLDADGRIRLTDGTGGPSRLALSLQVARADGTTGTLGTPSVTTVGRDRELQQGRDAIVTVDGQTLVRTSNTITDAIPGVTLTLGAAEAGTAIDVTVARDLAATEGTMRQFVDAYNAIRAFFDEQREPGAPLAGNSALRAVVDSFTAALRTAAEGNQTYTNATLAGVTLDRFGRLTFNANTFRTAVTERPAEIEALFGFAGIGTAFLNATDNATRFGTGPIPTQIQGIDSARIRLRQREADALRRLEDRRASMVQQFTRMEEALARLNAQGSWLASQMSSLQNQKR
jgi:flagellar hook-associated protein 2